jgi:predicted metalloprotease with PDZ domain
VLDYATLVEPAGLVLRVAHPEAAFFGALSLQPTDEGALLVAPVPPGTPAAEAGLASGDHLLALEGRPVGSAEALAEALTRLLPGDEVTVSFVQRGALKTARVTLGADPEMELVTFEALGRPVPAEVRALREAWLGSKADG